MPPIRATFRKASRGLSLILPAALVTCHAAPVPQAEQRDLLRNLEATRLEALVAADTEVLERLHAADFQLINPYGEPSSRSEYLSQVESGQLDYTVWQPGEMAIRLYDGAAVIRYEDRAFQAQFDGQVVSRGRLYHTNLYENHDGNWQIVWSHASGGQ